MVFPMCITKLLSGKIQKMEMRHYSRSRVLVPKLQLGNAFVPEAPASCFRANPDFGKPGKPWMNSIKHEYTDIKHDDTIPHNQ